MGWEQRHLGLVNLGRKTAPGLGMGMGWEQSPGSEDFWEAHGQPTQREATTALGRASRSE